MPNNYLRYKFRLVTGSAYKVVFASAEMDSSMGFIVTMKKLGACNVATVISCESNLTTLVGCLMALNMQIEIITGDVSTELDAIVRESVRARVQEIALVLEQIGAGHLAEAANAKVTAQKYALKVSSAFRLMRRVDYVVTDVVAKQRFVVAGKVSTTTEPGLELYAGTVPFRASAGVATIKKMGAILFGVTDCIAGIDDCVVTYFGLDAVIASGGAAAGLDPTPSTRLSAVGDQSLNVGADFSLFRPLLLSDLDSKILADLQSESLQTLKLIEI